MKEEAALEAIPRILNRTMLRRVIGTTMRLDNEDQDDLGDIIIGSQIPPYVVRTIDCPMNQDQLAQYAHIHGSLSRGFKVCGRTYSINDRATSMGGRLDMGVHRRMRHAAFSVGFEYLLQATKAHGEGSLAQDIKEWRELPGCGVMWPVDCMRRDEKSPSIPRDRASIARFLTNTTPKFSTLLAIVQ